MPVTVRSLARWCFRHTGLTLLGWVALIVALVAIHSAVGSAYTDKFTLPSTQSFNALHLLQKANPKTSGETDQLVIGARGGRKVTDPEIRADAERLFSQVGRLKYVGSVISPYTAATAKQIAPAGTVAYADVNWGKAATDQKVSTAEATHFDSMIKGASNDRVTFAVEGNLPEQGNPQGSDKSITIGFVAAAIVLFLAFGSFVAMLLPLVTAGFGLGAGISVVGLLTHVLNTASFTNELALLIGLGVGVDYALFIVTRYRQALLRGASREDAVVEAIDTSGRAVLFAGITVCIAMLGMFALGISFFYGIAVAAAVTVAFTVASALTVLPALLNVRLPKFLGGRLGAIVPRRRERRAIREGQWAASDESPVWARWSRLLGRRPIVFAVAAAVVMIVIMAPFFHMRLGSADAGTDPTNTTTRTAYDLLAKGYGPGRNGPLELVAKIDNAGQLTAFKRAQAAVAKDPDVVATTPVLFAKGTGGRPSVATADVIPKGSPQAASTANLLKRIRSTTIPQATRGSNVKVLVGGTTAIFVDFSHVLAAKLPLFIGIVVALSFLLLMAVFRSLLIPLTAAVMNLLSAGAAFGVLTAVFQNGWGNHLIGLDTTGPIEAFVPELLFPILFGLSMDYEVFLISRIYEEWHRRGDTREAVTHGLAATARTITAAAAIMFLVFASFTLGGEWVIDMFGIGLAAAVFLDALIVRSVLVPALTMVLGERTWWIPDWLGRLLPHLNVEGQGASAEKKAARASAVPVG
ncbi:MAG TPA: MMPL family transporter [Solirubrobacteraceae bacterium]|nr:MMPL family transporter [Solirubrobacteraceae bacterium]